MFGAINIDLLATASVEVVSDDSTPGTLRRYAGGVGRNIAENLARLGCDVSLVSVVGDDPFGRQILDDMQQVGVDVSQVGVQPGGSTASYTAVHRCDGEMLHAISDMRLFDEFQVPGESSTEHDTMLQAVAKADAVVLDANLPEAVLKSAADFAHATKLYADGVSRSKCTKLSAVLANLSLLKVNREEAIALTSCDYTDDETLLFALRKLGPERVLLTSGDEGVVLFVDGVMHRSDAFANIEVVSTSGAGDAMLSGVIAADLAGLSVDRQLKCGMQAAAETLRVYSACSDRLSAELLR